MNGTRLLVVFATLTLLSLPHEVRGDTTSPGANFSLVSPQVVASLKSVADTPKAQARIASAKGELAAPPGPLERIHVEGTLPHQGIWDQSIKARQDWSTMLDFAFAYRFTGDKQYLDAAQKYLTAWIDTYKVSYNPIDETTFDHILVTYDLTRADLPPDAQAKINAFLTAMARGYADAEEKNEKDNANWESHRIKIATLTAFATGNAALIERAHQAYLQHLSVNIRADGSIEDFYKRDALHYVTYDLEPLLCCAIAAKAHGQDWYHAPANHPLLSAALDWLTPYAMGEKSHEEFVHSAVKFDAQRAAAGLHGYSGPWEPANSGLTYQEAAQLDPKYAPTRDHVLELKKYQPSPWSGQLGLGWF